MTQGFIVSYQAALEEALAQPDNPRWKPAIPRLFSRLIHYFGTDAKLRVFRFERWIPGKWMDLHKLYMRATELGVERVPVALGTSGASNATHWTIEQEYLFVLLVHQLNTGNLSPAELDWATAQLRAWSRKLQVDAVPRSPEGFFVDLAGKGGPRPPHRQRFGIDAPLSRHDAGCRAARARHPRAAPGRSRPIRDRQRRSMQQRVAILEKVRPAVSPNLNADLRRDPRVAVTVAAKVRVGLGRICRDLAATGCERISQRLERRRRADRGLRRRRPAREAAPWRTSTIRWRRRSRRSAIRCGR